MVYSYSLYGLIVQSDFCIPFLQQYKNEVESKFDVIIKHDSSIDFEKNLSLNETLSDLNLSIGNIENRYYKCRIINGHRIEYKFKDKSNNISLLINFLHMPFAFLMFQNGYLPLHGMSFLHNKKTVISLGMSGCGKSSLSSSLSATHKIRSEDITCTIYKNNKIYSMPSFPITLSEENYSEHLEKHSLEKISRGRVINCLKDSYDNKKLIQVKRLYILEWGNCEKIIKLKDSEALKKILICSFKPYPFNSCIESEKIFFKNIMGLIRHNEIYLFTRKKDNNPSSQISLIKHLENDSS